MSGNGRQRPILPEAGNRAIDHLVVQFLARFVVDAELLGDPDPIGFEYDIRLSNQTMGDRLRLWLSKIKSDIALVAIDAMKIALVVS